MALKFPLSLPATPGPRHVEWSPVAIVATSPSPFTLQHQVQVHQGQMWRFRVEYPSMDEIQAAKWIRILLALNGSQGTFLWGDPIRKAPFGLGTGMPVVDGFGQSGQSLNTSGWPANTEGLLIGGVDLLQLGGIDRGSEGVFSGVPTWPTDLYIVNVQSNTITIGFSVTCPSGGGEIHWAMGELSYGEKLVAEGATATIIHHGLSLTVPPARLYRVLDDVHSDASGRATINIWPRLREVPGDGEALVLTNPMGTFRLRGNLMPWDISYVRRYGIEFEAHEAI